MSATPDTQRIAFITGKLAAPALRETVERLNSEADFEYEVIVLNIAVAALMTTGWVARKLQLPRGVTRVILPGYVSGDLQEVQDRTSANVERGPKDLRAIPELFGAASDSDYGDFDIEIVAEINHVPQLSASEVLAVATRYRDDGADIIDLGCNPDGNYAQIGERTTLLREAGFRVSVDSLQPREITDAVAAGAELVLSVNGSNIDVAQDLDCEVVVIPDAPSSLDGLEASISKLESWRVPYRIDPVIEPIAFGFAKSLGRYLEVRKRYPNAEILMGVGNLTELTDADSAAINVALLGFCQEISILSVLTTEVVHWAHSCVRELDLARRLVHFALRNGCLPKHLEPRLHLLRDDTLREYGERFFTDLSAEIKDHNFRIFAERERIHVLSAGLHVQGRDPFELFEQLSVKDPSHAFYLGYEMAKAVTALTLGKNYVQDEALKWGFLTREEESHLDKEHRRSS